MPLNLLHTLVFMHTDSPCGTYQGLSSSGNIVFLSLVLSHIVSLKSTGLFPSHVQDSKLTVYNSITMPSMAVLFTPWCKQSQRQGS